MFATSSIEDAKRQLDYSIWKRLQRVPSIGQYSQVFFPVGILFIRGDRAGEGGMLAEQMGTGMKTQANTST